MRISVRTFPLVVIAVIAASCTNSGDDALRTTLPPATQEPGAVVLSDASSVAQAVLGGVVVVNNLVTTETDSGTPLLTRQSTGSGVVVAPNLIITNRHVVVGAHKVTVQALDGRVRDVEVVASLGERSDLALLRVSDTEGLTPVALGDSLRMSAGEGVVVIGNPLGIGLSVATGVVSAGGRVIRTPDAVLHDIIQTDAAINPGNSGGALFDSQARLIGLNTAIRGESEGIGFAIPVEQVIDFLDAVENGKQVRYVGVGIVTMNERMLSLSGTGIDSGVGIHGVAPDSPASEAGLVQGDIVVAIDGEPTPDTETLLAISTLSKPGDTIIVDVIRPSVGTDSFVVEVVVEGLDPVPGIP